MSDLLLSTAEAAALLRVSLNTVGRAVKRGELTPQTRAPGKGMFFDSKQVEELKAKRDAEPARGVRRRHMRVIESMVASIGGLAIAANEIEALDGTVTREEAARLASDLSNGLRSLNRIKQLLKEV